MDFENQVKISDKSEVWPTPDFKNTDSTSKKEYVQWIEKAKDIFSKNYLEKIMLSKIKSDFLPENFNSLKYFILLKKAYPNAFISFVSTPLSGTWIGATPELLLERNGNKVSTISLAGTKLNTPNKKWTNKEYHEQELVTKYIHSLFLKNNLTDCEISQPFDHVIGNLIHLKTTIKGTLPLHYTNSNIHQLLQSLHPTPAVGGVPKKEALELIPILENHDRYYYSGYMGLEISPIESAYYVNLRCMYLSSEYYSVITGAGITEGSVPESEWEETENKANLLLQLMMNHP
jgi:isochorismate synthase